MRWPHIAERLADDALDRRVATLPRSRWSPQSSEHGWDGEWFRRAYDDFGNPSARRGNAEGQIFIESQGMCVMAGIGLEDGRAPARAGVRARASGDAARHRPSAACLSRATTLELGEISHLSAGLQGERRHLLPHQSVDHDRRGDGRATATARSTITLRINPSARERIERAASLRAVRVRADDRRQGRAHAR